MTPFWGWPMFDSLDNAIRYTGSKSKIRKTKIQDYILHEMYGKLAFDRHWTKLIDKIIVEHFFSAVMVTLVIK